LKTWGDLKPGTTLPKSITLFPRVDPEKSKAPAGGNLKKERASPEVKPEITFETLAKIDLRVATVVRAEAIPKARKLLKLELDVGSERTIVAGIAASYKPEDLVGKQIVIVANLKPAKLMGVVSNGMLLAASSGDGLALIGPDGPVKPGTPLS
jgi:methionyl-tRNA synthetase